MLDPRKAARLLANRDRVRAGRTQTVTLVYNRPEGAAYVAADVIWQYEHYPEPDMQVPQDAPIHVRAELPITIDATTISYIADTPTATAAGVAAARTYEIISYRRAGIVNNRWMLHLKRLR